jgi:hypothetical protein
LFARGFLAADARLDTPAQGKSGVFRRFAAFLEIESRDRAAPARTPASSLAADLRAFRRSGLDRGELFLALHACRQIRRAGLSVADRS